MKYTREQLEAMPDRELDAVVAVVVMGLNVKGVCVCFHCEDDTWGVDDDGSWVGSGYDSMQPVYLHPNAIAPEPGDKTVLGESPVWLEIVPFYSTDIAAAWECISLIDGACVERIRIGGVWRWTAIIARDEKYGGLDNVVADTAPRAISIAAVLAVQEANK